MALLTDGLVSGILDLTARDTQVLNVAVAEGIDLSMKLALAQEEIGGELGVLLTRTSGDSLWFLPPDLGSVVVTKPLKLWHTLRTLELIYADAYCSQLNDRYAGKRDQFRRMAERAYETLIETGIGIASCPVPQPGIPEVAPAAGAALPDNTYFVTTAWVNAQGEEGTCAIPTATTTSAGTQVQCGNAPRNAAAWNVYVGTTPETMTLQNPSPLLPGQTWLQPGFLNTSGRAPGLGQAPSFLQPVPRLLQRG